MTIARLAEACARLAAVYQAMVYGGSGPLGPKRLDYGIGARTREQRNCDQQVSRRLTRSRHVPVIPALQLDSSRLVHADYHTITDNTLIRAAPWNTNRVTPFSM